MAAKPREPAANGWSTADVAAAKAECAAVLKGLKLDFGFAPSIRRGQCGSAQPIEVRTFGGKPAIAVQPPAIMNCQLAAKLARWFETSVQPLARSSLKSEVVAIKNEAAYDCRNRYGDPGQKLSEHATANALDIGAFSLANGRVLSVQANWGPVLRDVIKAAKTATPATGFAAKVLRYDSNPATASPPPKPAITPALAAKKHMGSSVIRKAKREEAAALGVALPPPLTAEASFIHAVHASACQLFGTVLGPEANDAHREHFHVDLAPRPRSAYCE